VIGLEALGKPVIDTTTTVVAFALAAAVLTAAVLRLLRADRPLLGLRWASPPTTASRSPTSNRPA